MKKASTDTATRVDMTSSEDTPNHMAMCLFKVYDYTTEIVGRYDAEKKHFFVDRGDGTKYVYGYGVEWYKVLEARQATPVRGCFSDDYLDRFEQTIHSDDVPSRYIRMMASELKQYRTLARTKK